MPASARDIGHLRASEKSTGIVRNILCMKMVATQPKADTLSVRISLCYLQSTGTQPPAGNADLSFAAHPE